MSFPNKIDGFGVRRSTTADEFVANSGVESRATFIRGYVYCDYQVTAGVTYPKGAAMVLECNTGSNHETASSVDAIDTDHPIGTLFRWSGAASNGSTAVATDKALFAGVLHAAVTVAAGKYAECIIQVSGFRDDVTCASATAIGSPIRGADDASLEGQFEIMVAGEIGNTSAIALGAGVGADVYLLNPLNL